MELDKKAEICKWRRPRQPCDCRQRRGTGLVERETVPQMIEKKGAIMKMWKDKGKKEIISGESMRDELVMLVPYELRDPKTTSLK